MGNYQSTSDPFLRALADQVYEDYVAVSMQDNPVKDINFSAEELNKCSKQCAPGSAGLPPPRCMETCLMFGRGLPVYRPS